MSLLKIAQLGSPVLRKKAAEVVPTKIKSEEVQRLIESMILTLKEEGGVGLATPQVFSSKRIIIIHSKPTKESFRKVKIPLTVIVNPQIIEKSKEMELDWEGCLSVFNGNLRAIVPRHQSIIVQGFSPQGNKLKIKARSFFARILQHEVDHLDGILFIERIRKQELKYLTDYKNWVRYYKNKWPAPRKL